MWMVSHWRCKCYVEDMVIHVKRVVNGYYGIFLQRIEG